MTECPRRFTTGCWTCSLRRKKCDGARPECHTCSDRNLRCDGFGAPPAWMSSKEAQSKRLTEVKRIVKENFKIKIRKTLQSRFAEGHSSPTQPQPDDHSAVLISEFKNIDLWCEPIDVQETFSRQEAYLTLDGEENTTQSEWSQEEAGHVYPVGSSQPSISDGQHLTTVTLQDRRNISFYVDTIFPAQFWMCHLTDKDDKEWLASFFATSSTLRDTTVCLSILFEKEAARTWSDVALHSSEYLALEYYGKALNGLIEALKHPSLREPIEQARHQFECLATIVQLVYFEMHTCDFHNVPIHTCAAQTLLLHAADNLTRQQCIDAGPESCRISSAVDLWIKPAVRWLSSTPVAFNSHNHK